MILRGVIFDLDGVVTQSAAAHAESWRRLFDGYLQGRQKRFGEPFVPFDMEHDYLDFVDGKPRYEGVRSFLASRRIEIPYGDPGDAPGKETVCGLGNQKNLFFQKWVAEHGVEVYPGSLQWIHQLKSQGISVAMATSSKNGALILETTGLEHLFEATVDGNDSARLQLAGKPHGDIFIEAARRLGLKPEQCAVVEDALSGVEAGKEGHFALVIGVARRNSKSELLKHGADVAVEDLGEFLGKYPEEIH